MTKHKPKKKKPRRVAREWWINIYPGTTFSWAHPTEKMALSSFDDLRAGETVRVREVLKK